MLGSEAIQSSRSNRHLPAPTCTAPSSSLSGPKRGRGETLQREVRWPGSPRLLGAGGGLAGSRGTTAAAHGASAPPSIHPTRGGGRPPPATPPPKSETLQREVRWPGSARPGARAGGGARAADRGPRGSWTHRRPGGARGPQVGGPGGRSRRGRAPGVQRGAPGGGLQPELGLALGLLRRPPRPVGRAARLPPPAGGPHRARTLQGAELPRPAAFGRRGSSAGGLCPLGFGKE